jgi:hypothetical protein
MKKLHSVLLLASTLLLSACAAINIVPDSSFSSSSDLSSLPADSLAEIGFSSSSAASSATSSKDAVSSDFSSVSSSLNSSISVLSSSDFRVAPRYDSSAASMDIYKIGKVGTTYRAEKATSIRQDQPALTAEEVAEYYVSYRSFPPNYFANEEAAMNYGTKGRMVSTYYSGSHHSYDYTVKLGTFNVTSGGIYYEFDIDLTGRYNTGSSISRGAGRVVVVADGIKDYGSDPVCYYTSDHYADFKEYYNFYQGWSPLFAGIYNKSGSYENSPTSTLSRPKVPTVIYTIG